VLSLFAEPPICLCSCDEPCTLLLQFFTRPFVDGDSVLVQAGGMTVSGVVEKTTIMRTSLRTDDDVVVTIPNKVCAVANHIFRWFEPCSVSILWRCSARTVHQQESCYSILQNTAHAYQIRPHGPLVHCFS
jgi:hypothetical protein